MITQFPIDEMNQKAIEMSLKHDEEIVCQNATVVVDSKGNISWLDNNVPLCVITEDNDES